MTKDERTVAETVTEFFLLLLNHIKIIKERLFFKTTITYIFFLKEAALVMTKIILWFSYFLSLILFS